MLSAQTFDHSFLLLGFEPGPFELNLALAQILTALFELGLNLLCLLLVGVVHAAGLLKLNFQLADLALEAHLDAGLLGGRIEVESFDLLVGQLELHLQLLSATMAFPCPTTLLGQTGLHLLLVAEELVLFRL